MSRRKSRECDRERETWMEEGVLTLSAGPTVICLLPPLTINRDELDTVISKLLKVLAT